MLVPPIVAILHPHCILRPVPVQWTGWKTRVLTAFEPKDPEGSFFPTLLLMGQLPNVQTQTEEIHARLARVLMRGLHSIVVAWQRQQHQHRLRGKNMNERMNVRATNGHKRKHVFMKNYHVKNVWEQEWGWPFRRR